jgi:tRNA 2-thiouridine synthesizing protein C
MSVRKKLLYLYRRAPHGTIYAWETLQTVLVGAAFEQEVSLLFVDDGVYQLLKGSDTQATGMKNFMPIYRVLGDYEVQRLYVDQNSLAERGLTATDLCVVENPDTGENLVEICNTQHISALLAATDVTFSS